MEASAAAAQCHYRAGRFPHAIIEFERCDELWNKQYHKLAPIINDGVRGERKNDTVVSVHNQEGDDDEEIILADDDGDHNITVTATTAKRRTERSQSVARRVELIALPPLARHADLAMCRFRSLAASSSSTAEKSDQQNDTSSIAMSASKPDYDGNSPSSSTSKKHQSISNLWKEAFESNRTYRQALKGAALSLVQTCNMELVQAWNQQQQQQRLPQQQITTPNTKEHYKSIQKAMKSTSLAILMAGIAAAHLYLHNSETSAPNGNNAGNNNAWNVLTESAVSAADLMHVRREWMDQITNDGDGDDDVHPQGPTPNLETSPKNKKASSLLEESLCILNETLCKKSYNNIKNNSTFHDKDDDERSNVAMHSFRSALKVAALAAGKLILPKVVVTTTTALNVPPSEGKNEQLDQNTKQPSRKKKKRQKIKNDNTQSDNLEKKDNDDADTTWINTTYAHSSPMLHARDRLIDALSFHCAAIRYYPQKQQELLFIDKREVCFDEAVEWENRAGALYYCTSFRDDNDNGSKVTAHHDDVHGDGCAGYVWKVRTCLHGMEVAYANATSSSCHDDLVNDNEEKRTRATTATTLLQSLEVLASSSSSRFACDLLGCIHAMRGEFSRAIDKFQLSLDQSGEEGNNNSLDSDEEIGAGLTERRTIVNMAFCFLAMGEVDPPLELLLHLWMTLSESSSSSSRPTSIRNNGVSQPMALLLSSVGNHAECTSSSSMHYLNHATKIQLLWKLFHASSLAQDWSTCLNAMEEMAEGGDGGIQQHQAGTSRDIARAFALLQCRRPSAAREILDPESLVPRNNNNQKPSTHPLLAMMAELYSADAIMLSEQSVGFVDNKSAPTLECTQRAFEALVSITGGKENDVQARNNLSLQELQVTIYNDHGIALLMAGDSVGALRCLREAANHSSSAAPSTNTTLSWLLLPTYFNLSLLLLRDGHMEESAKSWLHARGHLSIWQQACRGDNKAVRKLKDLRVMAINRHGLLMAKRGMQEGATIWDQENIMEWVPPVAEHGDVKEDSTRVGGVDASQITALDVVLLRYAVTVAEKKASSSFRRSAGLIGY